MATISLTIPDAQLTRAVNALCAYGGFTTVSNANAKAALAQAVKNIVLAQEQLAAQQAIVLSAPPDVT